MFGNMTIRKKLIGSMGLVLIISAAAITVALSGMRQIGEQFNVFMEREMVLGQEINTMYAQGLQMGQAVRNVILNPSDQTARKNFTTSEGGFAKALSSARELSKADPEITRTLDELAELRKRQAVIHQQILADASLSLEQAVVLVKQKETPVWREIREKLLGLVKSQAEHSAVRKAEMSRFTQTQTMLSLMLGVASLLVGALVAVLLTRAIVRSLNEVADVAHHLADGDLTVRIKSGSRDEVGQVMAAMETWSKNCPALSGKCATRRTPCRTPPGR